MRYIRQYNKAPGKMDNPIPIIVSLRIQTFGLLVEKCGAILDGAHDDEEIE